MNNEEAIKLLDDWIKIPDDLGDEFWEEFMRELNEERFFQYEQKKHPCTM